MTVKGSLITGASCDSKDPQGLTGMDKLKKNRKVAIGPLTLRTGPVHTGVRTRGLVNLKILKDLQSLYRQAGELEQADSAGAVAVDLAASEAVSTVPHSVPESIHELLGIPVSSTQTTTMTFLGHRQGREVLASCAAEDNVRSWGMMDGPHFTLSCRIVEGGAAWDLEVRSHGSWTNYQFGGALAAVDKNRPRARLASQSIVVLGAGIVTGFELRQKGVQIGALSFREYADANHPDPDHLVSKAWQLPGPDKAWDDAVATTLGIDFLIPWPSPCDDQQLRQREAD